MLTLTTGPATRVRGAKSTPSRDVEVICARFSPYGTFAAELKNGLCPVATAWAVHPKNHTIWDGSPHTWETRRPELSERRGP